MKLTGFFENLTVFFEKMTGLSKNLTGLRREFGSSTVKSSARSSQPSKVGRISPLLTV